MLGACQALLRTKPKKPQHPERATYLNVIERLFRRRRIIPPVSRLKPESVLELRPTLQALPECRYELFEKARKLTRKPSAMVKISMPKAIHYLLAPPEPLRECFLHAPSRIEQ